MNDLNENIPQNESSSAVLESGLAISEDSVEQLAQVSTPEATVIVEAEAPTEEPVSEEQNHKPVSEKKPSNKPRQKKPAGNGPVRSVGFIALPVEVSQMVKKYGVTHPGLVLNKYAVLLRLRDKRLQYDFSNDQKKRILQKVAHLTSSSASLKADWENQKSQRQLLLTAMGAHQLNQLMTSPLVFSLYHPFATLGIELHPIYGFPHISATHIKGALRKFVEEYWLPKQENQELAQQQIQSVFGQSGKDDTSGDVVFHDAWPETWPSLSVEQIANHHKPYYLRREMPGDWQVPETDCFLVIKPGSRFSFPITARRPDLVATLLPLAEGWLKEMLATVGLGTYRQQGYGLWKNEHSHPEQSSENQWKTRISLTTPAFLAGATQRPEDCRIRPGMIRGLLRWWWRTMHSGFLNHRELFALETAIWGSEKQKGALRLNLDAEKGVQSRRYRPEDLLPLLPEAEGKRRSPGLVYLGYGLFSENTKRYYISPDASWEMQLVAQNTVFKQKDQEIEISAEMVLEQAKMALWLFCRYGGVGQRQRKGFGSLQSLENLEFTEEFCLEKAAEIRKHCHFIHPYADERAETPSLMQRIELPEIATPWKNSWFVLHQLGESLQSFMQEHKHEAQKKAMGLPRVMADPVNGTFEPIKEVGDRHASPYFIHLKKNTEGEYLVCIAAFPAARLPNLAESQKLLTELVQHMRADLAKRISKWPEEPNMELPPISREGQKKTTRSKGRGGAGHKPEKIVYYARNADLEDRPDRPKKAKDPKGHKEPGERKSRREGAFTDKERKPRRESAFGDDGFNRKPRGDKRDVKDGGVRERRNKTGLPQSGDWIEVILLEERTKKGGWRAEYLKSKLSGPIVNTTLVPGDKNAGDTVEILVHASNKQEMMFRWPTEKELEKHSPRK